MNSKKLISTGAILVFTAGVLLVVSPAHAQENTSTHPSFLQGLVQMISQKFGLDQNQVQAVANDFHKQKMQNMETRYKTHLDQLVKDGKITSAQEQAIINELAALKSKYNPDGLKNLTPEQRRQKLQDAHDELQSWAKTNNIDPKYLLPGFGMGRGMKRAMRWGTH